MTPVPMRTSYLDAPLYCRALSLCDTCPHYMTNCSAALPRNEEEEETLIVVKRKYWGIFLSRHAAFSLPSSSRAGLVS